MLNCDLCETQVRDCRRLCPRCAQDTADLLGQLPDMYERLGEMLLPGSRAQHGGGRRPVAGGAPASVSVIDVRAGFSILTTWHGALAQAREWTPPGLPDDGTTRIAVAVAALQSEIKWIAGHWEVAGDFAREVARLHRDTSTVVEPVERGLRAGRCPALVDGRPCGAPLRLPPGGTALDCKWCGSSYPSTEWVALRLAQDRVFRPREDAAA